MAKKSLIAKAARPQKYKTRAYTRCNRCGLCLRELAHEGFIPGMTKSSW